MVIVSHMPSSLFAIPNSFTATVQSLYLAAGVDIFFAISGYVVCKNLVGNIDACGGDRFRKWEAVKIFWVKRAYRLLPASWFWMFFPLLGVFFFNASGSFGTVESNIKGIMAILLYVANFAQEFHHVLGANGSYWSLALEEQFYFALPFFLVFSREKQRVPALLAILAALIFLAKFPSYGVWRLDAIVLGVLCYFFSQSAYFNLFEPTFLKHKTAAVLFTLVMALASASVMSFFPSIPFPRLLVGLVSVLLVFAASFDKEYILPVRWLSPLLIAIGNRSYSVYLAHMPAYLTAKEIWLNHHVNIFRLAATAAILVMVFTEFSYRVIELPMRKKYHALKTTT